MEAGASVWALHATVAAEEVAAHAEGEAVRVVLAEELVGGDAGHPGHAGGVAVVVDETLGILQVRNVRQSVVIPRVHHPLHLAATVEGIAGHQESWLLCNKI